MGMRGLALLALGALAGCAERDVPEWTTVTRERCGRLLGWARTSADTTEVLKKEAGPYLVGQPRLTCGELLDPPAPAREVRPLTAPRVAAREGA